MRLAGIDFELRQTTIMARTAGDRHGGVLAEIEGWVTDPVAVRKIEALMDAERWAKHAVVARAGTFRVPGGQRGATILKGLAEHGFITRVRIDGLMEDGADGYYLSLDVIEPFTWLKEGLGPTTTTIEEERP